jgi:hypothetical protein
VRSLKKCCPLRIVFEKSGVESEDFHRFRALLFMSRDKEESGGDEGTSKKIC